jgi:hypothetical protein
MCSRKRIVICGGGAIGAATAYFTSRRGARPIVIERHEVAGAASGKSGGFLALDWCRGSPLDRLARRSFELHAELSSELGDTWGYRRLTTYAGYAAEDNGARCPGGRPWLSEGVAITSRLGSPESTALLEPRAFTTGLMRAAEMHGAMLRHDTVVHLVRGPRGAVRGVALAYSWTTFIDERGSFLFAKEPVHFHGDVYDDLLEANFVASGSNILVRKRCAEEVGRFDTTLGAAHDWDFCLRVAARWPFAVVPRYQILYRLWDGAMSGNAARAEQACLTACERAFRRVDGVPVARRQESLSNVKQYVAFLYLARTPRPDFRKEAGRKLAECIRLYPRTLLRRKTLHLLLTWFFLLFLPARAQRPAVIALLRWWGRWSMLWHRDVRELVASYGQTRPS